jgi:hypothetical protein
MATAVQGNVPVVTVIAGLKKKFWDASAEEDVVGYSREATYRGSDSVRILHTTDSNSLHPITNPTSRLSPDINSSSVPCCAPYSTALDRHTLHVPLQSQPLENHPPPVGPEA